ncbi:calmodulin binding protein PICBP isoform X1 [Ziziphus jujuba]|uniref:Calmodulin binding protein PICBP isoform X1 n=2 Tax=Ziziphus jujuba TaxID=326968 RepID=A0A6P4AQ91_ZIZJJ|nr:calmodulin binding protein PICBP isoform X1 [Ziziphus jujuba]XP_060668828.1 calmodulin binding protein PICBP isoform X1 [Ziziphus jujuba]
MVAKELEIGTGSISGLESEHLAMTNESAVLQKKGGRSEGESEVRKKKLKKVRSIKLSKSPSLRPPIRRAKPHSKNLLIDLSSEEASSTESSPSHSSICSDARTNFFQKPARTIARRSSFKAAKTLSRMSSTKFKKPLMRKVSGGTEGNKMKTSGRHCVSSSGDEKASRSSSNKHFQASELSSESSCCSGSSDKMRKKSVYSSNPNSNSPGQRSSRVLTRTSSLKPSRISTTKMASIKAKSGSIIEKPTCSSTLKDAKFSEMLKSQHGGNESHENSLAEVCPFTYCSLHGHRHAAPPPLKRLISIRRRLLKSQKGKVENRSLRKEKYTGKANKKVQTSQMVCNGQDSVSEIVYGKEEINAGTETTYGEGKEEIHDSVIPAEELQQIGELNTPVSEATGVEDETVSSNHENGSNGSACNNNDESESTGKSLEVYDSECGKPLDELRRPKPDKLKEISRDYGVDSVANSAGNEADSIQRNNHNQKYMRMWHLMYKHSVRSINGRAENQLPLDQDVNKTEQVEDAHPLGETDNFGSCQGFSETNHDRATDSDSESNQKIEIHKNDAIQMVQEAFDEILLPEIQDHSYDGHSVTSSVESDQELSEHRDEEWSTSNSTHSSMDNVSESREETLLRTESTLSSNEEKTSSKVGDISNQKNSKSWSNLRRIIILKRFFKALEKVRRLDQWKSQSLPLEHVPEAEKINLRHQTLEERKSAEEWMLDYALQKVVSKLAPAQQRRVAQLVKAFETVLPFPDIKASLRSNVKVSSQVDIVQVSSDMLLQSGQRKSKESEAQSSAENMVGKTSHVKSEEYTGQAKDFLTVEPQEPVKSPKLKETSLACCGIKTELDVSLSEATGKDWKEEQGVTSNIPNGNDKVILPCDQPDSINIHLPEMNGHRPCNKLKPDDIDNTCHEGQLNGKVQEVHEEINSSLSSEPSNKDSELCGEVIEANNIINAHGEQSETSKDLLPVDYEESIVVNNNVVSSASTDPSEDAMAARKENNGVEGAKSGFPQGFHQLEGSEPERKTDVAQETQLEKQSYTKMWFLVYKHMVSGIAADGETNLPDGEGKLEMDYGNTMTERICGRSSPFSDQDTIAKDSIAENQSVEFRRLEAIKLVEKAIDDILLPENKNNSLDDQSSNGDSITDQETQERNSSNFYKESFRESGKEEAEESRVPEPNISIQEEQEESVPKVGNKNWNNLKKLILLKRFINALEKVRKFTPKGPRFLPLEADQEAEKVHLKHQDVDDRKSSEEWKLDYALQQAASRLTPARKRKVELLVEAFETVIPTIGS